MTDAGITWRGRGIYLGESFVVGGGRGSDKQNPERYRAGEPSVARPPTLSITLSHSHTHEDERWN